MNELAIFAHDQGDSSDSNNFDCAERSCQEQNSCSQTDASNKSRRHKSLPCKYIRSKAGEGSACFDHRAKKRKIAQDRSTELIQDKLIAGQHYTEEVAQNRIPQKGKDFKFDHEKKSADAPKTSPKFGEDLAATYTPPGDRFLPAVLHKNDTFFGQHLKNTSPTHPRRERTRDQHSKQSSDGVYDYKTLDQKTVHHARYESPVIQRKSCRYIATGLSRAWAGSNSNLVLAAESCHADDMHDALRARLENFSCTMPQKFNVHAFSAIVQATEATFLSRPDKSVRFFSSKRGETGKFPRQNSARSAFVQNINRSASEITKQHLQNPPSLPDENIHADRSKSDIPNLPEETRVICFSAGINVLPEATLAGGENYSSSHGLPVASPSCPMRNSFHFSSKQKANPVLIAHRSDHGANHVVPETRRKDESIHLDDHSCQLINMIPDERLQKPDTELQACNKKES